VFEIRDDVSRLSLTRFGGRAVKPLASLARPFVFVYFVAVVSLWKLWNRRFHSFHSTSSLDFVNRVNGAHAPDVFWFF
jgi:hypothetical protein